MFRVGTFAVFWLAITRSFEFTVDRSVLIPITWNTASFDIYKNVSLNNETQMIRTNKPLRTADVKILTKINEVRENETREEKSTTENMSVKLKLVNQVKTTKNDSSDSFERNTATINAPQNIVLLLMDKENQDERREEDAWKDCEKKLPFAIKGFFQICHDEMKTTGLSSASALISENKENGCNCERALHSNIGNLLNWARNTREMTIGVVSSSNFSISYLSQYESLSSVSTEFDGFNESDTKLKLRRSKRDSNDSWQVIDLNDQEKSLPSLLTSDSKTEGTTNYEGAWDIFDMFSKIRMAFFRSLLESLTGNDGTYEDESRRPFSFKPTVANLIEDTIKELKSIPNDKGYMLIAVMPSNERAIVLDLLQRETSAKDTLLIATQICYGNEKSIPFVAQGPSNQVLREVKTIWELPSVIEKAVASNRRYTEYVNRRERNIPVISRMPIGIFSEKLSERKHAVDDREAIEKPNIVNLEGSTTVQKETSLNSSKIITTV